MSLQIPACLGLALVVSGCAADYLNNYDTLTLRLEMPTSRTSLCRRSTRSILTVTTPTLRVTDSVSLVLCSNIAAFR
ncbi:hypothetical protein LB516_20580 [Mesorhizobium sp. CO1-1-7]|uniref:hypothetical protein n=1 Tax=Mesorhizobium sp. CO1-1-7 TaxID=2876632 RepID=UPI001CD164AB|nr:hypothetical protein [Mesorhizobium sp. CO1-1-7]MBZ9747647.1 hypothetical protein [Mesorhizobium sp. CO1-1-7]